MAGIQLKRRACCAGDFGTIHQPLPIERPKPVCICQRVHIRLKRFTVFERAQNPVRSSRLRVDRVSLRKQIETVNLAGRLPTDNIATAFQRNDPRITLIVIGISVDHGRRTDRIAVKREPLRVDIPEKAWRTNGFIPCQRQRTVV